MLIYYIHKHSRAKGPYDLTGPTRNMVISKGDLCVKEYDQGIAVYLVVSDLNSWNACKLLGKSEQQLGLQGNITLFFFNGIQQRSGLQTAVERLCTAFDNEQLNAFFTNTLHILTYQCDQWDISLFHELFVMPQIPEEEMHEKKKPQGKYVTVFESYLDPKSDALFTLRYSEGKSLKDIYQEIRKEHPQAFRKAFNRFLKENPHLNLYDKYHPL